VPRSPTARLRVPVGRFAARAASASLVLALVVTGCRATTELGPPKATPTDMGGIAVALQRQQVRVDGLVSGDAGCADPGLAKTAISFKAFGLDQATPVAVHLFIFTSDAAYQRSRPAVDACARSFVTDPSTYEAIDASPYVFAGQGPWGPKFKDAVRAGLLAAAQGG
jgi:hypothetical protein